MPPYLPKKSIPLSMSLEEHQVVRTAIIPTEAVEAERNSSFMFPAIAEGDTAMEEMLARLIKATEYQLPALAPIEDKDMIETFGATSMPREHNGKDLERTCGVEDVEGVQDVKVKVEYAICEYDTDIIDCERV
jgi:hypothetical protein